MRNGQPLPPQTAFRERTRALGIADTAVEYGREGALLVFRAEDGSTVTTETVLNVELAPSAIEVPSLLGRDVLSEARLDFNMPADDLVLDWDVA